MRFLMKVGLSAEKGNSLVRTPNMGQVMDDMLSDIRPEEAYFAVEGGQRTLYLIVNVADAHELPRFAEPFWLRFEANVEFIPVMKRDDLMKAVPDIERLAKKY